MKLNKLLLLLLLITGSQIFAASGGMDCGEDDDEYLCAELANAFDASKTHFPPSAQRGEIPSRQESIQRNRAQSQGSESARGKELYFRNDKRPSEEKDEERHTSLGCVDTDRPVAKARRRSAIEGGVHSALPSRVSFDRASSGYHSGQRFGSAIPPELRRAPDFRQTPVFPEPGIPKEDGKAKPMAE